MLGRAAAIAALLFVAGCVTSQVPLSADGTAVIPGSETAGQSQSEAVSTVLYEAARITVGNGYQFFRVGGSYGGAYPISPGINVTMQVVQGPDARPGAPGVWNAEQLLNRGAPESPSPYAAPPYTARCTAYGCVW
jgi:hypothetical protein